MSQSVLIVIPTLNEAAHIRDVVATILRGASAQDALLVVADGGSTDGTIAIVEQLALETGRVRLLHNPGRLQSAGVNLAVARFGEGRDITIRCDAHSTYPDGFVDALTASLLASQADSVVIPMDTVGTSCLQKAIAWLSDSKIGSGGSAHRGGRQSRFVDHGHHAAIQTKSFERIGGYEESFSHNEDAEFDCRLREAGGRIFLDADIRIEYQPRSTLTGLWQQYFNYGRGRSRTVRRHPKSLRLRQFLVPAHVVASMFLIALFCLFPAWPILLLWPATYLAILAIAGVVSSLRRKSLCGLLIPPAAFIMHTAWALGFFWGMLTLKESPWTYQPQAVTRSTPRQPG